MTIFELINADTRWLLPEIAGLIATASICLGVTIGWFLGQRKPSQPAPKGEGLASNRTWFWFLFAVAVVSFLKYLGFSI